MFENLKNLFSTNKSYSSLVRLDGKGFSSSFSRAGSLSLYEKSLYANAAIRKRAEKVGQIDFVFRDAKGEEIKEGKEIDTWTRLLNRPNQFQTGDQFWGLSQKYYDVYGSAFILKEFDGVFRTNKVPTSLRLLNPANVTVQLNATGDAITGFTYTSGSQVFEYEPEEIIYRYQPSPASPLIGESLLGAAATAIEAGYQIEQYHANVLRNGGKLEMLIKVKNSTNARQVEELAAMYDEKYTDAKKAGRPLIVGGDIEAITTGLSPRELAFLDTKVSTFKDISIVTGVPIDVLGVTSGSTYSNADAAIRVFLRETIKPQLEALTELLDWTLIPDHLTLDFLDPTPEDREERRKDLETAYAINALTTNEMRAELGREPVATKEADQILVPFNLRPLEDKSEPKEEPKEKVLKKESSHPLKDKAVRTMWGKVVNHDREQHDARMLEATRAFFKGQEERVLGNLPKSKRKIGVDEAMNMGLEVSLAKESLVPVIRQIFIEQGMSVAETFGLPKFSMTAQVERVLATRAEMFTTSIINTQHDKLQRVFKESLEAQEPRRELVERISGLYTEVSDEWAGVIARTEVHAAMQDANLEAYKQGGLTTKIWVWSGNTENLREIHFAIDGEEVGIDEPFSTGEQAPSLPNCACTI